MPLSAATTSSNGYCGAPVTAAALCGVNAARSKPDGDNEPANAESPEVAASPATISRRLSNLSRKGLRRLKFVVAKLLRAPQVRCRLFGHLAVNRKLFFGLFALAEPAIRQCQIVVSRRIAPF